MSTPEAKTAAPQATDTTPVTTDAATPKNADPNKPAAGPQGKNTNLKIRANYENIPGSSTKGAKVAMEDTALWFDPLTIAPTSPSADDTIDQKGISHGGSQVIANQLVPLHGDDEDGAGEGTGTLTAQLKYAEHWEKSYTSTVKGEWKNKGDEKKAEGILKAFVTDKLKHNGDLIAVAHDAEAKIAGDVDGAKNVKVTIAPNETNKSLADAGKTHVYYKARKNPSILLDVPVVQVAEKVVTSGGSTTKNQGSEVEGNAYGNATVNKVKVDDTKKTDSNSTSTTNSSEKYHAESKRTYMEVIKLVEDMMTDFTSDLIDQVDSDTKYDETDRTKSTTKEHSFEDYSKKVDAGTEEGDKDKKNWAAYLEDVLGTVSDGLDIPFVKDLPGGKWLRRLNEIQWGVDLGKKASGIFAVRGKVHYKDSNYTDKTTDTKDKTTTNDSTTTKDGDVHNKTTATSNLKQKLTSHLTSAQSKYGTDNTTVDVTKSGTSTTNDQSSTTSTDDYNKTDTTANVGGSVKAKANQSTTAEITWSQSVKETTTKPILQASIVDGDGEVSSSPFGAPAKNAKKP